MSAENNYDEILEEVCNKLNNINSVKEVDVLNIKSSVESIENLITDTQAKLNFQEIKEKLEKIASQVDNCNDALLKDLYNDINNLKNTTSNVNQHLENIQNIQNLALTSAEFEEYQKQQLDLALKTNENIFNELSAIKANSQDTNISQNLQNLLVQLENLHKMLTAYMQQIASKAENTPTLDEIAAIMADLANVQQKNIKQTNVLVKEIQVRLSKLHNDFSNKDFDNQITKISEIYDSLCIINNWIEKVGYVNHSIENVYARLGENIDFDDVSEKVDIIYENISALNNWASKIDNIDNSMPEIQEKIGVLGKYTEDVKNITEAISSVKDKLDNSVLEDVDFNDISAKLDIVYENMSAFNEWAGRIDKISDKISDIKDNIKDINISEKIDDISDKIEEQTEKVSNIEEIILDSSDSNKLNDLSNKIDEQAEKISNIEEIILDSSDSNKLDDLSNKIDEQAEKISDIKEIVKDSSVSDKLDNLSNKITNIKELISNDPVSEKMEKISNQMILLSDIIDNSSVSEEIGLLSSQISDCMKNTDVKEEVGSVSKQVDSVSEKVDSVSEQVKSVSEKVSYINKAFEDDVISSKIDLIYENISLLNDWVNKIDGINERNEKFDSKYNQANESINIKIDEITDNLLKACKIVEDVPDIKDKLSDLSGQLHSITFKSDDDSDKYIYGLFDIETDFHKIHESIDAKSKMASDDINALKERFSELNDDISSISLRTNRLILSADDANKEFKTYLESFKNTIQDLDAKKEEFNPELKFSLLSSELTRMNNLLQGSINTSRNLNNAFIYLAEWIDATGVVLNTMQTDLSIIKNENGTKESSLSLLREEIKSGILGLTNKINEVEESCNSCNSDDISELRSLLTGIIVQLNTALTPHIDSLNDKIDKFIDEQANKVFALENYIQEKINAQDKQISAIEDKIENLNNKFDKLIDSINDDRNNHEIKDILNYIATQIAAVSNETIENKQSSDEILNNIAGKLSSFDENINKIVNYIEED